MPISPSARSPSRASWTRSPQAPSARKNGSYVGLGGLTVNSFGNSAMLASQASIASVIEGRLGSFTVQSEHDRRFTRGHFPTPPATRSTAPSAPSRSAEKIQGGADALSGSITSNGAITSLTVTGGLLGGAGTGSGSIAAGHHNRQGHHRQPYRLHHRG